jgi:hypothetical protein
VDKNKPEDMTAWFVVLSVLGNDMCAKSTSDWMEVAVLCNDLGSVGPHPVIGTTTLAISRSWSLAHLLTGKTLVVRYGDSQNKLTQDLTFQLGGDVSKLMAALRMRWMTDREEKAVAEAQAAQTRNAQLEAQRADEAARKRLDKH